MDSFNSFILTALIMSPVTILVIRQMIIANRAIRAREKNDIL